MFYKIENYKLKIVKIIKYHIKKSVVWLVKKKSWAISAFNLIEYKLINIRNENSTFLKKIKEKMK